MTKNAQQALKYLMQSTNYNVRFCLICNYISRIDEALQYYRDYHYDGTEHVYLKHQITSSDKTNKYISIPENIQGISKQKGLELASSWLVNDVFVLDASFTYSDSTQEGVDEIRRAKNIGSVNLLWRSTGDFTVNVNAQYNGEQTDINSKTLDAFTLVNVNANWTATDKLNVYLRLDNLFDESYQEVFGYQTLGFGASLGVRFSL